MTFNVKDQYVHDLVKHIAGETGEKQTAVVRRAVEELHQRMRAQTDRSEQILRGGQRVGALLVSREADRDPAAFLYGDDGMPQ